MNASADDGVFDSMNLITKTGEGFQHIFRSFGTMVTKSIYWKTVGYFTVLYSLTFLIGVLKSVPKHQYSDIEHGSSDWAVNGEQYRILDSKNGIVLAEKNFLPVDKHGNTNVLVVGRVWFW